MAASGQYYIESEMRLSLSHKAICLTGTPLGLSAFRDDLHEFNIDAKVWTDLSSPVLGTKPTARDGHGFASAGGKLYVHGGRILTGELEALGTPFCPQSRCASAHHDSDPQA